jgi:hypothetical protein
MECQLSLDTHEYFYVYILGRPNGSVFYVGKGCRNRIDQHEREAQRGCKCDKCEIIRNIWRSGGAVVKKVVYHTSSNHDALVYEGRLIQKFRDQLVNKKGGRRHAKVDNAPLPSNLRVASSAPTKKEQEKERRAIRSQREARLNILYSRLNGALKRDNPERVRQIEEEIAAVELLIYPPVQLQIEGL